MRELVVALATPYTYQLSITLITIWLGKNKELPSNSTKYYENTLIFISNPLYLLDIYTILLKY